MVTNNFAFHAKQAGVQRGESADSEHNSDSGATEDEGGPQQPPPHEAGSREGAGESGGSGSERQGRAPRPESLPAQPSKLGGRAAPGEGSLDPATVAEMARRRRERFGTPGGAKSGCAGALRKAASGLAPKAPGEAPGGSKQGPVPRLSGLEALARSHSSLAELVESDLFLPETPRRGGGGAAASKTGTPTLGSARSSGGGGAGVKAEAAEGGAAGFAEVGCLAVALSSACPPHALHTMQL